MEANKINRGDFDEEELEEEQKALKYPWDARQRPDVFIPVQHKKPNKIPYIKCIDWWNTRSNLLCCCFPCLHAIAGKCSCKRLRVIDATDPSIWKEQLEAAAPKTPEPLKGVWWLKYNHAPEELVTIFNDANFSGTTSEDGTSGAGYWRRAAGYNWTSEYSAFGYGLSYGSRSTGVTVRGSYNFEAGIVTVRGGGKEGSQWVYRINDNEWWKVHYNGDVGEPGDQEINFMYKWLKVLDKDGNPTEHWEDYIKWTTEPLPHRNCGTSWLPCWPMCLSHEQAFENMTRPNPKQIIYFGRKE